MLHKKQKILVVDDEVGIATTCATILEDEGYETAIAYSGEEAVQVADSFQPDFILSDVIMGGMNGVQAVIEILRVLPKCKVLFFSGNAGVVDFLGNARAKGFHFEILVKPVPPPELLRKITQILSSPAERTR